MHVLMLSLDTSILTQQIGNARQRHDYYAQQVGRVSLVVCNRGKTLDHYQSAQVTAQPTNSISPLHYLLDAGRIALQLIAQFPEEPIALITAQEPFVTGLVGLRLRRRMNVPLIIQDHSSFLESRYFATETPRNRLLRWIAQQTLPRADAVRVVNWQEKAGCVRLGLPSERVCVIPLVPNITQFATADHSTEAAAWRQRLQATAETPILLWVGRPVTFKNLPLLLDTFALIRRDIPAAKLIIAGNLEGTTVPAMITARGLGEAIHTPGSIPHHELPGLFQAATMYLLTSNYEGLPGVLLEASAAALPIVSTANNGAKDLINDGETGILAPIGDAPALARACLDLIRHPERRQQIGQAARKSVFQHYNEQTLMNRWVDMWRHVAAKVPPCDY